VFVVGNLREGSSDMKISRLGLIRALLENTKLNVHVYGPPSLKEYFPSAYQGFAQWNKLPVIFSNAKVSLNINASGVVNGAVSTRAIQIMSCGGLLVSDGSKEMHRMFTPNMHYLELPENDHVGFIEVVVKTQEAYQHIRHNARQLCMANHTWSNLASIVKEEIVLQKFDYVFYSSMNGIDPPMFNMAWSHWRMEGRHRNALTVRPEVDPDFDWERYVEDNQIDRTRYNTEMKAWVQYLEEGRRLGMFIVLRKGDGAKRRRVGGDGVIHPTLPLNISPQTGHEVGSLEDSHLLYAQFSSIFCDPYADAMTCLRFAGKYFYCHKNINVSDVLSQVAREWLYGLNV
jgi:hypothetical protein